jgi:hypothetical protein
MDDIAARLGAELARVHALLDQQAQDLAELSAAVALLVDVLVARGDLGAGHPALIERVRSRARRAEKRTVRLGIYADKYAVMNPDIDCASLVHLCRARCCTFSVQLTRQDLDEGGVAWEIDDPYLLRHDRDGYCAHFARATGGCTTYERRPGACRTYDCRQDPRVWVDYDQRIPAPLPLGVGPIPLAPR